MIIRLLQAGSQTATGWICGVFGNMTSRFMGLAFVALLIVPCSVLGQSRLLPSQVRCNRTLIVAVYLESFDSTYRAACCAGHKP